MLYTKSLKVLQQITLKKMNLTSLNLYDAIFKVFPSLQMTAMPIADSISKYQFQISIV